ncbi:MAG: hypothetical protein LBU11_05240 [Zoogloeaceae bacterium]|jgi:hypothetical protein|nr:hypothetical protein [Zoogloeaceae bacterium]
MTHQQFVGLAICLFAIWLVLSSIRYLSSVPMEMAQMDQIAERAHQTYCGGRQFR